MCEIKLFQNYFGLRRHPSEIIIFERVEDYCNSQILSKMCVMSPK